MEYEYNALHGDLPDVYAFDTLHKFSALLSNAVPCNVEDLDHGWRVLDHQPIQSSPAPNDFHYHCNFETFVRSQPDFELFI